MAPKATKPILILTTVAKKSDASRIAKTLVEERLAACVTILPGAESRYSWKGKVCIEKEFVLLIKTLPRSYAKLEPRLKGIHPYECPEIIVLPISRGFAPYLLWIQQGVR